MHTEKENENPNKKENEIPRLGQILESLDFFKDDFDDRQEHIKNLLCRYLNTKTVVAFIGSGTSYPLGYPTWVGFAEDIISILRLIFEDKELYEDLISFFEEIQSDKDLPSRSILLKLEKIFEIAIKEEIVKKESEIKRPLSETEKEEVKKEVIDKTIKGKLDNYLPILCKLTHPDQSKGEINYEDEINTARDNYKDLCEKHIEESEPKYFQNFLSYIKSDRENELNALAIFSECERVLSKKEEWEKERQSKIFRAIVKYYFENKHKGVETHLKTKAEIGLKDELTDEVLKYYNPYHALLELPIRKFVTPNYDVEIERALLYKNAIQQEAHKTDDIFEEKVSPLEKSEIFKADVKKIIQAANKKSFSQVEKNHPQLTDFSVARYEESKNNVFHCHGRIDNIKACVVSEEDYQKWYLQENSEYIPFRQTLDISLDSNPILFMGFGLKDADLMRILRQITANNPIERNRKPLFCLLYVGWNDIYVEEEAETHKSYKWRNQKELEDECTALYMKYGLHVIPVKAREHTKKPGDATCHKLLELHDRWENWWNKILQKPKFRKSPIKVDSKDYYHYKFEINDSIDKIDERMIREIEKALNLSNNIDHEEIELFPRKTTSILSRNLAVIIGHGGTGKSWGVQKFLEKLKTKYKIFFWSSYYSNDVLTGIDRLIEFFKDELDEINSRAAESYGIRNRSSAAKLWRVRALKSRLKSQEEDVKEDKFNQLIKIVDKESNGIIVFDGIEKLLNPNKENTLGESVSPEIRQFFKIISDGRAKKKIILTSRLFPADIFHNIEERIKRETDEIVRDRLIKAKTEFKQEKIILAPQCWLDDLRDVNGFKELCENNAESYISEICGLLNGHVFGVALVRSILKTWQEDKKTVPDEIKKLIRNIANTPIDRRIKRVIRESTKSLRGWQKEDKKTVPDEIKKLIRNIANTPIDRRIQRVIRESIKSLDSHFNKNYKMPEKSVSKFPENPAAKFIERISLFMHPIRKEVARICFDISIGYDKEKQIDDKENVEKEIKRIFDEFLTEIVNRNLLQKVVRISKNEEPDYDFVVHPLIRGYVFEELHESLFVSLPSLQLPGFTSSKEIVDPGKDVGRKIAIELFEKICEESKKVCEESKEVADKATEKKDLANDLCRSAFSILRSRFCSNTVARWGNYDEYSKLILKLYDTAKVVSDNHWKHAEPTKKNGEKYYEVDDNEFAPLYPDELTWVYNEVGLVSHSTGNNMNALALWEQGYDINQVIDRGKDGRYIFHSIFSLGSTNIHYGKLNLASKYLDKAFEIANYLENKKLANRVLGHIALVKYLQGNLEDADKDFKEATDGLTGNPRGRSVFYNYHGELLLKMGRFDEAEKLILQSLHLADAHYFPDLVAYARLSLGNLHYRHKRFPEAQTEFQYVLTVAKEKKLRRLEASTLSGLSRVAENLGDFQTARLRAIESLKISNEYLLCLHQTVGLIVLGKSLVRSGPRDFGLSCLKTAKQMAKTQGYFLRMNEAEQELQKHEIITVGLSRNSL